MAEAQRCISSREFAEWLAYYQLEPFGEEPADVHAATIATLIANAHRNGKKQPKAFRIEDFRLQQTAGAQAAGQKTPDQLLAIAAIANAALGGRDARQEHAGMTETEV